MVLPKQVLRHPFFPPHAPSLLTSTRVSLSHHPSQQAEEEETVHVAPATWGWLSWQQKQEQTGTMTAVPVAPTTEAPVVPMTQDGKKQSVSASNENVLGQLCEHLSPRTLLVRV